MLIRPVPALGQSLSHVGTTSPLSNSNNDEFSRLDRCDTDDHDEPAVIEICLRHRGSITSDKKCLFRLLSLQHPFSPQSREKVGDRPPYLGPQGFVVGFKDHPLRALLERGFNKDK